MYSVAINITKLICIQFFLQEQKKDLSQLILKYFSKQIFYSALRTIWVESGIRKKLIPDPEQGVKKHQFPDPNPQHWHKVMSSEHETKNQG